MVLNLDIKQTAPVVAPYEEALATVLRRFGRADDVIVASFLDSATDAFSTFAPEIPTSAGTLAVAAFVQAVRAGETPAPLRHVALQVPARFGDATLVDAALRRGGPRRGPGRPRVDRRGGVRDGELCGLGVDGIITDRPSALVAVLERLGCAWRPER